MDAVGLVTWWRRPPSLVKRRRPRVSASSRPMEWSLDFIPVNCSNEEGDDDEEHW